jgi:hypothetical protein
LIAATAEQDKPSSLLFFKNNFEKVCEVQAHSRPIQKMRLTYDNTKLITVGDDGVVAIFHVVDKDLRNKKDAANNAPDVVISDKILIEKRRRDDLRVEN